MAGHLRTNTLLDISDLDDPDEMDQFDIDEMDSLDNDHLNVSPRHISGSRWSRLTQNISLRAFIALLLWYSFSIGLSVYNKYMFSGVGMDFKFPILTTSLHQLVQLILATISLLVMKIPLAAVSGSRKFKVIATIASAGDIGLGNSSLILVTLSFYTMIKSSALGFVLLFSVIFGIEQASVRLGVIIAIMTTGVLMMVFGETGFSLVGFFCVLGASCCSGLRWASTKLLLGFEKSEPGNKQVVQEKSHPLQAIWAIAPGMFVCLLVWGLLIEGPKRFVSSPFWSSMHVAVGICALLFPGLLAFCMTWAEFELLGATGPLTLAVAGICKEVATICVSVLVFHDKLTWINGLGIVVTIASIALFHYHKLSE